MSARSELSVGSTTMAGMALPVDDAALTRPSPLPSPPPPPQGQLGLPGMPRRLYSCTPTRLTCWLDCPRRYRFSYLERPPPAKGPPWAHNSLGAAVHVGLADWWRQPEPGRTVPRAGELLNRAWRSDGFRDDQQAAGWRVRARDMVERYVAGLDPRDEPCGVERTVATRTPVLALSGRVDRLDVRPGPAGDGEQVVVVDYKTGRFRPNDSDAGSSLALALYAIAAGRVLRRPAFRVELHHLPSGDVAGCEHTPESLERHLRRAEQLAEEAADADARYAEGLTAAGLDSRFPPRPGRMCAWCDFNRHCPEGRAAASPKASWEGVGEPEP